MSTRSIAAANQKGGVGKTTTVVSLAACLAERGKKTLLVDIDPQANATSALGLEKLQGGSVYQALLGNASLADSIRPSGLEHLDVIPSEVDLAVAEVDVARAENYLQRLQFALTPIAEGTTATGPSPAEVSARVGGTVAPPYDFILVDCAPSLGILTMNALAAVDSVIVPLQCEYFALEGLAVIMRVIQQIKDSGANPSLELEGIVLTMYDGRTNLAQQVAAEVRKHFPGKVYKTVIPRTVRLAEAPSFGKPITRYDPHSYAANCYRSLTEELLGVAPAAQSAPASAPTAPATEPAPSPVAAPSAGASA
jgi:chromosome partitioning protein